MRREGTLDGRENGLRGAASLFFYLLAQSGIRRQTKRAFLRLTASLEYIPGVVPSETAVGFDGRWNPGEESRVELLEEEIGVGQVGETGQNVCRDECHRRRKKGLVFEEVLTSW